MTDIRRALLRDMPACAEIVCAWEYETPYIQPTVKADEIAKMLSNAFDAREFWVTGTPIDGYMALDPVAQKIGAIYMTRRGQGLGQVFLETAKKARDFLWLTVFLPNVNAQRFYHREGFAIAGTVPPPAEGQPEMYRMEWHR